MLEQLAVQHRQVARNGLAIEPDLRPQLGKVAQSTRRLCQGPKQFRNQASSIPDLMLVSYGINTLKALSSDKKGLPWQPFIEASKVTIPALRKSCAGLQEQTDQRVLLCATVFTSPGRLPM